MGIPQFVSGLLRNYGNSFLRKVNREFTDCDNLYVDCNGFIHPCCHPEKGKQPESEEEMLQNICDYLDRIVTECPPKKLLFLSVDGVAPRAKMNQQRSRRFTSAMDIKRSDTLTESLIQDFTSKLEGTDVDIAHKPRWDHNVITPGTPFMQKVTHTIRWWICDRLSSKFFGERTKDIKILFSDASVPGEGEQKIFDYIRLLRNHESYNNPHCVHVIHGLDADLVMLALTSHQPNVILLREDVFDRQSKSSLSNPLNLLYVSALRKKLVGQWRERIVTEHHSELDDNIFICDYVLLCCIAGNDFLPHLPWVYIKDGHIDTLLDVYYNTATAKGRHFIDAKTGTIDMKLLLQFFAALQKEEESEFSYLHRRIAKEEEMKDSVNPRAAPGSTKVFATELRRLGTKELAIQNYFNDKLKSLKSKSALELRPRNKIFSNKVIYGTGDWKAEYYATKFEVPISETDDLIERLSISFLEGMCWVWRYYSGGVPSWKWYFPFHFAPLASDISALLERPDIDDLLHRIQFGVEPGKPLKPFEQLLTVMPKGSAHCLPSPFQELMLREDSPLGDFYPDTVELDLDGEKVYWKAVSLLSFVEEDKLLNSVKSVNSKLVKEEKIRNSFGNNILFFHKTNEEMVNLFLAIMKKEKIKAGDMNFKPTKEHQVMTDDKSLCGFIYRMSKKHIANRTGSPIPSLGGSMVCPFDEKQSLDNNMVSACIWFAPNRSPERPYVPESMNIDEYLVDIKGRRQSGGGFGGRGGRGGRGGFSERGRRGGFNERGGRGGFSERDRRRGFRRGRDGRDSFSERGRRGGFNEKGGFRRGRDGRDSFSGKGGRPSRRTEGDTHEPPSKIRKHHSGGRGRGQF